MRRDVTRYRVGEQRDDARFGGAGGLTWKVFAAMLIHKQRL